MSDAILERVQGRSGELACVCDPLPGDEGSSHPTERVAPALLPLAAANGFSILAQALSISVLPTAGVILAPNAPGTASLPFVALLVGAGLATVPAAYLTTGWDRRFGFALGASMGLAGACMAAWAIVTGHLNALCLGAFWIGVAQGFAAFYRHGAAQSGGTTAIGLVIGSGALAALLAPGLVEATRMVAGPLLPAALILFAGAAYLAVLAADLFLPPPPLARANASADATHTHVVPATVATACAWFAMAAVMGASPLRMADCGIATDGQTGYIAWHLMAMYLPALAAGWLVRPSARVPAILGGVACAVIGLFMVSRAETGTQFGAALVLTGIGWSTTMVAATSLLHAAGTPRRSLLAAHDVITLAAAAAGAAASGLFH